MRFAIHSNFYPRPYEPNNLIQSMEIDVICPSDAEDDVVAGRISVDFLDIVRVERFGASLFHVCDADSAEWTHLYETIVEPATDFRGLREDFEFEDPIHGIAFIRQIVLHPALAEWQQMVVDAVCELFSEFTAVVMEKDKAVLSDKELAGLGFRIVAGCQMLFRPNMVVNPYRLAHDERDPLTDLQVPGDAQDFIEERWEAE